MIPEFTALASAAPDVLELQWGVAPLFALLQPALLVCAVLLAALAPTLVLAAEPEPELEATSAQAETAAEAEPAPAEAAETAEVGVIPVPIDEPAEPASKDAVELDTIEVTASKRVKSQREIPGSVGAIRGDELEKMRAQGLSDYLKLVPGVSLADFGGDRQIPVIRGIASALDQNQFTAYTTGVYLEEMPFNDLFLPLSIPNLNPFDLERVEVLKGPQGTLFGASALAGAIRYIARKPELGLWQAKLSATQLQTEGSGEPSRVGAAAINAPIGDSAALRVVGLYRHESGLYDARPNGDNTRDEADIDKLDQATGRALLRWDLGDRTQFNLLALRQDTDQDDDGSANQPDRFERNDNPFPGPTQGSFSGVNLSATHDFDALRVFYSGNVLDKTLRTMSRNEPALPDQLGNQQDLAWYNYFTGTISGTTHELRFSSPDGGDDRAWEWLAGAALFSYREEFFQFAPNPGDADSGYYANPPEERDDVAEADRSSSFLWATVDGDATETAVFGEVTGHLGEYWEATLGARAFETELTADTVFRGGQINALEPGQTESRGHYDLKESGINPKASLRYLHDRHLQAYVLAARGFQFGGVQISPPVANIEQESQRRGFDFGSYDSSELWNYEVGLRTEWLDRRLRFDFAAFYLDWKDLQLTIQVPINPVSAPPGTVPDLSLEVIVNVGAAHSEGFEAALQVLPFAGASFTSSAAWISALTDVEFDPEHEDGPVPAGTRLPGTPRFQWANVFAYENSLPYFDAWHGSFALTHSHIGSAPNAIRSTGQVGGYDTLDARASLVRSDTAWLPEIALGVNNLTNVQAVTAYSELPPARFFYFVRPRTTLLTLAWQY